MQNTLYALMADPALPAALQERAAAALCRREEARLWEAMRGRPTGRDPIGGGLAPLQLFYVDTSLIAEESRPGLYGSFRALRPHTALAFDDGGVAFACHCPREERPGLLRDAAARIAAEGCQGAASQPMDDDDFYKQLRLARLALRAGQQLNEAKALYHFEDYASLSLYMALQTQMPLSHYYADEVIRVIQHDYEKGTDWSKSLYVYLSCFMDLKEAAKEINVHRNTMAYHIKKIEGLLGQDKPDGERRFDMMCTYRMLSVIDPS